MCHKTVIPSKSLGLVAWMGYSSLLEAGLDFFLEVRMRVVVWDRGKYRITEAFCFKESLKVIETTHNLSLALSHAPKSIIYVYFKHLQGW